MRGKNTHGLGRGSPQPAHLSQTVLQVQHDSLATGLVQVLANILPNKQDIQFVPFLHSFMVHGEYKGSRKADGLFVWGWEGEMFEIGCGYNLLGRFLFTLRNSSSGLPSSRV